MKTTALSFLLFFTFQAVANVNYIDISKITGDDQLISAFTFIKENKHYYDHWTVEWNYEKSKAGLVKQLQEHYVSFSSLSPINKETCLLLGDIAHYLYNMDDTAYLMKAINNYNQAISLDPEDYRGYWFLGYHYALSNNPALATENFFKAEKILPSEQTADFWDEYAWATAVANMPSHCIYAMDKAKSIAGKEGNFQEQLGETIYKRIIPVDRNEDYGRGDMWTAASQAEKLSFISRPLGIKILVDSTWELSIYDYQKNQTAFIIYPPALSNGKGKKIQYTIAILIKTAKDNENLNEYIHSFTAKYPDLEKINFSDKYEKVVAYEIKDPSSYQDMGGAHMYMIGIERSEPQYPGLLLENPIILPGGNSGEVTYYTATDSKDRFKGKIFYAVMLDSCEDINEESLTIFKSFFDHQIIIE